MMQLPPKQPLVFVYGKVNLNNQPVESGMVFAQVGHNGNAYHSAVVSNGQFLFLKAIAGQFSDDDGLVVLTLLAGNVLYELVTNYHVAQFNTPIWRATFSFF